MDQQDARRSTLLVVMIVITIGLVIGGVTVVNGQYGDRSRRQNQCGKNQSQIIGALIAYEVGEEGYAWSQAINDLSALDAKVPSTTRARLVTTRTFELLASTQSIPNALFYCPVSRSGRTTLKTSLASTTSEWGREPGKFVSYALDWAAPPDPNSDRPMLADRDPEAHRDSIMVVFGDAHVQRVRFAVGLVRPSGALVTEGIDGKPVVGATSFDPDDDLFSPIGDGGDSLESGKGDAKRAWVK